MSIPNGHAGIMASISAGCERGSDYKIEAVKTYMRRTINSEAAAKER